MGIIERLSINTYLGDILDDVTDSKNIIQRQYSHYTMWSNVTSGCCVMIIRICHDRLVNSSK